MEWRKVLCTFFSVCRVGVSWLIAIYLFGKRATTNYKITKREFFREKRDLLWVILKNSQYILRRAVPKNERTICLDKCLSCYMLVDMSRCFLVTSTWKLFDQSFFSKFSSKFGFDVLIHHSNSDSKFKSAIIFSDPGEASCFAYQLFSHVVWYWVYEQWWQWGYRFVQSY